MATLLDIKDFVADTLGTGNGSTSVPKRDRLINKARSKFYSERRWTFLFKTATITISSQIGTLSTDLNKTYDPIQVYTYTGSTKYQYTKVDWDDLSYYSTDNYVYAIDKANGQIKINQTSIASVEMDYTYLPADKTIDTSDDSDIEPISDITPIGVLAVAMYWLSSERATGKYQMFMDMYDKELAKAVIRDTYNKPIRPLRPRNTKINSGYIGA